MKTEQKQILIGELDLLETARLHIADSYFLVFEKLCFFK